MDTSAILGFQQPNAMQNLSGLLGVANSAQTLQQNQQKTQQGGIDLQERQNAIDFLKSGSFINPDGTLDNAKLTTGLTKVAPTIGMKIAQDYGAAHTSVTGATQALNNLTNDNRTRLASVTAATAGQPPDVMNAAADALAREIKGAGPLVDLFKPQYEQVYKTQGAAKAREWAITQSRGVLPQETQQGMNTPAVVPVTTGQQTYGVNPKPDVAGIPQGAVVPGTSVQLQPPPTQPVVGPNNQPGILGPQGAPPAAGTIPGRQVQPQAGVTGNFVGNPNDVTAAIDQIKDPQERANARAAFEEQGRRTPGFAANSSFIPTGPVPGAVESKLGSVNVVNDHWTRINAGAADSPVATSLLSTIRDLAPAAITGAEAGKRAYWNGLFNVLHIGTQATGDLQKDTDLLQKSMAQLNIATPATTDAMRTLVEAGRPHSTMSAGAIQDAAGQIEGQIKANMAMRNLMTSDKRYADATGDVTSYDNKRQALEKLMDPRIFQYESLPPGAARQAFINKINPKDRADVIEKTKKLVTMGVFQ